jgi:hypothetical protein
MSFFVNTVMSLPVPYCRSFPDHLGDYQLIKECSVLCWTTVALLCHARCLTWLVYWNPEATDLIEGLSSKNNNGVGQWFCVETNLTHNFKCCNKVYWALKLIILLIDTLHICYSEFCLMSLLFQLSIVPCLPVLIDLSLCLLAGQSGLASP